MNKLDQRFNLLDIFFLTDDNQEGPRIMISLISSTVLVLPREGEREPLVSQIFTRKNTVKIVKNTLITGQM